MRLVWFHTRKFSSCDEKLHDFSGEWMYEEMKQFL